MTWVEFVKRWPLGTLTDLGISRRTVYTWLAGTKEPTGWQRAAAEFWIDAKAGEKESAAGGRKSKGEEAEE